MYKFKVGKKVKCIGDGSRGGAGWKKDLEFRITKITVDGLDIIYWGGYLQCGVYESHLQKIGGTMLYDEIKGKIEAIDENTSLKGVDDILEILYNGTNLRLWIESYGHSGCIVIVSHGTSLSSIAKSGERGKTIYKTHFYFSNQCDKLEGLKEAMQWLLENSDIKKDIVGTKRKIEIEGKVYEAEIIKEVI